MHHAFKKNNLVLSWEQLPLVENLFQLRFLVFQMFDIWKFSTELRKYLIFYSRQGFYKVFLLHTTFS